MCLEFHNAAHQRAHDSKEDSLRVKSSTSTAPLQLQQFQQQQQQQQSTRTVSYSPLHDCYSAWLRRFELHCSGLLTYSQDDDELQEDFADLPPDTINVPSRIARLDGLPDYDDLRAELKEHLVHELVAFSEDSHTNYAAAICFDACIPRLLYYERMERRHREVDRKEHYWEEMPDVSMEHSVCEASLPDLFPIIHNAFLLPHGVHSDNIYVHFFWKIMPQRSVVRNYESMVSKEHFFENAESRWLLDRLFLCTLLGGYRHADPTTRPPAGVRVHLYSMFSRPRQFYTQRYTRGNTLDGLWQMDLGSTSDSRVLSADAIDAFMSGLLQHCREVVMFAVREYLVHCIEDDPAMRRAAQSMFSYDRFRDIVITTANKIRAYVSKNMPKDEHGGGDGSMTWSKLIRHNRHVHPHSNPIAPADCKVLEDAGSNSTATQAPPPKRQRRARNTTETRRGKLQSGKIAMTCYEWELANIVKGPTTQFRSLSFQKPIDPITKAFDSVKKQINRPVPWEQYKLLPVRMYLNQRELLLQRDERQISYHSHDPPPDIVQPSRPSPMPDGDNGGDGVDMDEHKRKKSKKGKDGSSPTDDQCLMNWDKLDRMREACAYQYVRPLHAAKAGSQSSVRIWQSAVDWQHALDKQLGDAVTQIYVTDSQITARHSFVLFRWLTQHVDATTPTIDVWNAFLRILPAFVGSTDAVSRLQKMTAKYYPYTYTKESWTLTVNHFADHYPYTYALVQAFVSMWKIVSTTAIHKLPLNYREAQALALVESAGQQVPAFSRIAQERGVLQLPSETLDLWFCSVCCTVYSLLDDPNSPYKHQYRTGLRDAIFDFESGDAYCYRTSTNLHMHCQAQPLSRLPAIERLIQIKKVHIMICPGCSVMMVLNTDHCVQIAGKGYVCSNCTVQWNKALLTRASMQDCQSPPNPNQSLLQQATECYICQMKTTKLWYYGPNTFLCRRHHKKSLARYLIQQSALVEAESKQAQQDPLSDSQWCRTMIHKFKRDFLEQTATARAKYNDAIMRRVKKHRAMTERR